MLVTIGMGMGKGGSTSCLPEDAYEREGGRGVGFGMDFCGWVEGCACFSSVFAVAAACFFCGWG